VAYAAVNLAALAEAEAGTLITPDVLAHDGLIRRSKPLPVKILGNGDAPKGVTVHAHAFSRSALDKLAAAGSTAQRISWPDGDPIDEEAEATAAAAFSAKNEAKAAARRRKRGKAGTPKAETAESADAGDSGEPAPPAATADDGAPATEAASDAEEDSGEGPTA
jgi:Ribosomal proteins 50S-L15, 50S-L18e, 60S-L27A